MKSSIVWLASYPKSGNTWLRIFLANYMMNLPEPVPINQAGKMGTGDSVAKYYNMVAGHKIDTNDADVVMKLRPKVLRGIVANNADVNLVKTHCTRSVFWGTDLIPAAYTRSAIYVLRNPLDMVLSYARHFNVTPKKAANMICDKDNSAKGDDVTIFQYLSSWAEHVKSWTSFAPYPTLVLRYEDMLSDPMTHFGKVISHLGVPVEEERLERAIRFSSFNELKKQEKEKGFIEKPKHSKEFFAKGQVGQWRDNLAPELIKKICDSQGETMKKYGYLDE